MKKMNVVAYVVMIIVLAIGLVLIFKGHNTSFQKMINEELKTIEVNSIEVIKSATAETDEVIVVQTDAEHIDTILNNLYQIELKKKRISNIQYHQAYWITIKSEQHGRLIGITLYDNNYAVIYTYQTGKNASRTFKITNSPEITAIQSLFE